MKPLRQWVGADASHPVVESTEPVAVLGAVARPALETDPHEVFDRAFFGLRADDVRAMGDVPPHLLELAWEALERSDVDLAGLGSLDVAAVLAVGAEDGDVSARAIGAVLGLRGPVLTLGEDGAGLVAVHLGCQLLRAGDADLVLVLGTVGEGVAAVVLGGLSDAVDRGWRTRGLVLGSVASTEDEPAVRGRAAARAGVAEDDARSGGVGLGGLVEVIEMLARGASGASAVLASGDVSSAAVVVAPAEQAQPGEGQPRWLTLSARTSPALSALAAQVSTQLVADPDLVGMAADSRRRPQFECRLAVPCADGAVATKGRIDGWAAGERGEVACDRMRPGGVAFVVPPAGAQQPHMAEKLFDQHEVFREAIVRCDRAARPLLPRPLLSALYPAAGRELPTDDPALANPMTFAIGYALAELYRSQGVVPSIVLGCGVGELLAACLAGVLDLEQALSLAVVRGQLIRTLEVRGERIAVELSEEGVREHVLAVDQVDIVAVPMPGRTVLGGTVAGVAEMRERLVGAGIAVESAVGHPAHSPLAEPILKDFVAVARDLRVGQGTAQWVSTATGRLVVKPDAAHWGATLRAPLRFATAAQAAYELGARTFVELAARPTMAAAGDRTLAEHDVMWLSALVPWAEDDAHTESVFAQLWVRGAPVHMDEVARPPRSADLPTYPWDRRPLDAEPTIDEDRLLADHIRLSAPESYREVLPLHPAATTDLEPVPMPDDAPPTDEVPRELELDDIGADPDTTLVPNEDLAPEDLSEDGQLDALPRRVLDGGVAPPAPDPISADGDLSMSEGGDLSMSEDGDLSMDTPPAQDSVPERTSDPDPGGADAGDDERVGPPDTESGDGDDPELPSLAPNPTRDLIEIATSVPLEETETLAPDSILEDVSVDSPISELEEIETEAYTGRPRALAEAEAAADAALVWQERWTPDPIPDTELEAGRVWVVLADGEGVGDYLAALLVQQGHRCQRVLYEKPYPRDDGTLFVPDPAAPGAWDHVLAALGTLSGRVRVLHLWSLDVFDDAESDPWSGWPGVLELVHALHARGLRLPIQTITRGAVMRPEGPVAATAGSLWGVGRLVAVETPEWFGGLVDLDPDDEDADQLLKHLLHGDAGEYAFRDGERYRRSLQSVDPGGPATLANGAWVIGGSVDEGALQLAESLVDHGIERLYLVGPNPPDADVLRGVLELQRRGVMCIVVRADLANDRDLEQVRQRLAREVVPGGVVVRWAAEPGDLLSLDAAEAMDVWRHALTATRRFTAIGAGAPVWVWTEGRGLAPRPGDGISAIIGCALDAMVRSRASAGAETSLVHTAPLDQLSHGQAVRLVQRLFSSATCSGAWRSEG